MSNSVGEQPAVQDGVITSSSYHTYRYVAK